MRANLPQTSSPTQQARSRRLGLAGGRHGPHLLRQKPRSAKKHTRRAARPWFGNKWSLAASRIRPFWRHSARFPAISLCRRARGTWRTRDGPLPIGERPDHLSAGDRRHDDRADQTGQKDSRVLEIGTGSGYQAAILAECVTASRLDRSGGQALGKKARRSCASSIPQRESPDRRRLRGLARSRTLRRDHLDGGPAPWRSPQPLLAQLKVGGRLVAPVGRVEQRLVRITRTEPASSRR